MQTRKIFISYSWTTPQHEAWVLQLAHRLTHDGVIVVLDKWDLKPGQDKFTFMEQMVHADNIDKVLIILDKKYTERANNRSGGVGTETTIISGKVYESATQEKFIPIVAERDENGNAFLPTYLGTRIYIDLSDELEFEAAYEQLLRQIYEAPLLSRPKLGSAPKYLFNDSPVSYKTSSILRSFDSQIDRFPQRINSLAREFFDALFQDLALLTFGKPENDKIGIGEAFIANLDSAKPLRDDFIEFLFKIIASDNGLDTDIIIGFFENLTALFSPPEDISSWSTSSYLNFRFITHEFWLYTVAISMKKENYPILTTLLQGTYFSKERFKDDKIKRFNIFYKYIEDEIKDYFQKTTGQKLITPHGHLLINRLSDKIKKSDLTSADLLCYYISLISEFNWFPITYIYHDEYSRQIPLISKLISRKHFIKVGSIFNLEDIENMKKSFSTIDAKTDRGYNYSFTQIPKISQFIKIDEIASLN